MALLQERSIPREFVSGNEGRQAGQPCPDREDQRDPPTHGRIGLRLNVEPLKQALHRHNYLFGEYPFRATAPGSPHAEMEDIWIRYNDIRPCLESGDLSYFADEHDSIWYPSYYLLPEVHKPIFDIMQAVRGERLGGVLITKLPPGGMIQPHTDAGWHAEYYDKYFVPIQNAKGAVFGFDDGIIDPEEGDVYWFDNSKNHWVANNSIEDRIAMIVCIKTNHRSN